jgi:2-dehydropantoate 2-reductase
LGGVFEDAGVKIAVVGAGAMGSLLGGLLAEKGEDVLLIGRSAHVGAIRRKGLYLGGVLGGRIVRLESHEELRERPDLTVFAVKTQDLDAACRAVAPLVGRGTVLTMQNGVSCDAIARRHFDQEQIVGCVAYSMATFLEPGRVDCWVRGYLAIGSPFGTPGGRAVAMVEDTLKKALPVRVSRDMAATRWTKLVGNLNNALSAATGRPLQEIFLGWPTSALPLRLMREGLSTLSAAHVRTDGSPQAAALRTAARLPEPVTTSLLRLVARTRLGKIPMLGSTWQSVVRGSPTEIDYLNGEIAALGERIERPTPYNDRVVRLVHDVERSGEFYPPEALWPQG